MLPDLGRKASAGLCDRPWSRVGAGTIKPCPWVNVAPLLAMVRDGNAYHLVIMAVESPRPVPIQPNQPPGGPR